MREHLQSSFVRLKFNWIFNITRVYTISCKNRKTGICTLRWRSNELCTVQLPFTCLVLAEIWLVIISCKRTSTGHTILRTYSGGASQYPPCLVKKWTRLTTSTTLVWWLPTPTSLDMILKAHWSSRRWCIRSEK